MAFRKKRLVYTKPQSGAVIDWGDPINRSLVGCWLMNEGAGGFIWDIARRNKGTAILSPTWTSGRLGQCLSFASASSQYVAISTTAGLVGNATAWTMCAWFKTSTVAAQSFYFEASTANSTPLVGIVLLGTGAVGMSCRDDAGINAGLTGTATTYADGRWHFLVGVQDSKSSRTLYIDGVKDVSNTTTIGAFTLNNSVLGVAHRTPATPDVNFMNGQLDGIRVFNRGMTLSEVQRLYMEPMAGVVATRRNISGQTGIQPDATSNSGYQAAASSYTWNHTCTGNDRYLVVGISMLSLAQTVTSITYNSVALTLLGTKASVSGAARIEMWGLVAPSTGTNIISVTLSGSIASAGNASSYTGVHQTSSTEAFNSAQATNVGAADATVDVTTVADSDWCVDTVATDDTAITVGAGQTQTGNVTGAGGSGAMSYEGPKSPAGTVTMSWTNVAGLSTWAIGSIALRPTGASALTTTKSSVQVIG